MSNQVIRQRSSGAGSGDDAPPSNGVHAIEMRSPSQEEEEENKKGKRPVRPQTRLERLVNCAETLFEYLTVGINLADVASDVFVAVQFYNNGDMVWFWLVVAFLALAHVVYTFTLYAVVKDLSHWQYVGWDNIPCFLRLVISLLLAQFAPVLNLIFQREHERHATNFDPTRMGCDEEDDGLGLDIDRGSISKAALEELKRIHDSRMLYVRMQKSFEQHMTKFGLFYVESGVEAAPQAIIQLLAITFLGRASWVQLVSLCCSLFSITSKAFVISRAYDLRVMIFKFACAAHDVFSTFYLFSTLVATETPKHASFFGLDVSWLGMLWLWKTLIVYVYSVISAIVVTFINIAESASHYDRVSLLKALGAGLFLSLPLLLFVEAAKTCWIVLYLAVTEPGTYMSPIFALVLSFVSHDDEKSSRLRYVFRRMEYPYAASQCCLPARAQLQCRRAADPTKPFTIWRIAAENVKEALPNLRVVRTSFVAMKPRERLALGWVVLSAALMFVAQLISLLYPFLNILFVAEQHNLLQTTCLYATLGAVTLLVCLAPRAALYAAVNGVFKESLPAVGSDVRTVTRWIEEYHRPTHIGVLQILVPVATLPQQVSGKVAQYLTPSDLGLQDLSVAECDALKQRLADTYGVEAAPDLQRQQSDVRPPDVMVPPSDEAAIIERVKELIDEQA